MSNLSPKLIILRVFGRPRSCTIGKVERFPLALWIWKSITFPVGVVTSIVAIWGGFGGKLPNLNESLCKKHTKNIHFLSDCPHCQSSWTQSWKQQNLALKTGFFTDLDRPVPRLLDACHNRAEIRADRFRSYRSQFSILGEFSWNFRVLLHNLAGFKQKRVVSVKFYRSRFWNGSSAIQRSV